jgi:hypothetical protein
MAAVRSAASDSTTTIHVAPWETRGIEIRLMVIGLLMLAFAGFVAAFPDHLGTAQGTTGTVVGPVTLAQPFTSATPTSTTVSVENVSTVETTSSNVASHNTSETLLGTLFGIGALIVLVGGLYRRVASVAGFGITIGLSGVVDDKTKQAVADSIAKQLRKDTPPEKAALVYQGAIEKLGEQAASQAVEVSPAQKPSVIDRLKGGTTRRSVTVTSRPTTTFSVNDVDKAVYDAKREQGL